MSDRRNLLRPTIAARIAALFCLCVASYSSHAVPMGNITIENGSGTSAFFYAAKFLDSAVEIVDVELRDNGSPSFLSLTQLIPNDPDSVWFISPGRELQSPLTLRLTAIDGQQLTLDNVVTSFNEFDLFDAGVNFVASNPVPAQGALGVLLLGSLAFVTRRRKPEA